MARRFHLVSWIGLVATVLLAACGTDTVVKYQEDAFVYADLGEPEGDSKGQPGDTNTPYKPDKYKPGGTRYEIVLLHDTSEPLPLTTGDHKPIRAKVIDYELNAPAVGFAVQYAVEGSNPDCSGLASCGKFLVKEGMTDAQGIVSVTFEAGTEGNVIYTVELTGENAFPASMDISVKTPPMGTLKVVFAYDGPIALKQIDVRVVEGNYACSNFNPVKPWVEDIVGQKTATGIDSTPTFSPLAVAKTYTVFATAQKKDTGHLAAKACADAVHLVPDEQGVTQVTLNLYVLTLNPAGTYDSVNHFNFTGAIPGQVGEIINLVVNVFTNPGKVLIDLIKELVSQYIGSWVTDLAFGLFEDALADIITDWLLNNSPDFIQDFFVMGQDIVQIVNNVELTSELKLSKLNNDFYFQGVQSWLGINLYWKLGCPKKDEPGYDPECGKHPFSLKDLQDTDVPMDLITGQFTGMIANYDKLIIDKHEIKLNYGKLILFVINELILPAISSFNSIEDLLYSLIDCQAVADGFLGDILGGIGIDKGKVKDFCTSAVGFIISPIEEMIGGLALDSNLWVNGTCRMLDENDDLMVDKLLDGIWYGFIEINGDKGPEFPGDFTAEKAKYPGQ